MIYISKAFRLYVQPAESGYFCQATGKQQDKLYPCDIQDVDSVGESGILIRSLEDVYAVSKPKRIASWVIAIGLVSLFIVVLWNAVYNYLAAGFVWYRWVPSAWMALCSAMYLTQAIRPVVHDAEGQWVDLRTGMSSLHGGCTLISNK